MEMFKNYFKYTFDFVGVCGRKDFWIPFSVVFLFSVLCWVLSLFTTVFVFIALIVTLLTVVPTTSLIVRRLHDTDRGAIYLLWLLLPLIGTIILMVYLLEKTKYKPC